MHIDSRTLPDQSVIEGDICIIGAGPAGISMALEWMNTSHSVILLEGGGYKVDNRMQDLYHGESVGQRYYALQAARLHFFGGTSGHWGGLCAPLDPIDFKKRSWVPDSGWPITWEELNPYYKRAQEKLELTPHGFNLADWQKRDGSLRSMPLNENIITHKVWQFSPPTRFGTRYRDSIEKSKNVTLYTHANVVGIDADESVSAISNVRAKNFEGKNLVVKARYYVLACGGIENARLLLCSNHQVAKGLGNNHDVVGRYFMEHLEANSADLVMPRPGPMKLYLLNFYLTKVRAELAISEKKQEEAMILNGTASLMSKEENEGMEANIDWFPDNAEANVKMWEDLDNKKLTDPEALSLHNSMVKLKQLWAPLRGLIQSTPPTFELFTRMEQSPNPSSRVYLSSEKDEFGMNRITLDWKLTMLEKRSIRKLYELLGQEIGRTGLGRVKLLDWLQDEKDTSWPSILGGGWHHMGTTRMHDDPTKGVVDANCKLHGIHNLYVAGSSCFTTSGVASPTLNLVALTLRLSDHLKNQIENGRAV